MFLGFFEVLRVFFVEKVHSHSVPFSSSTCSIPEGLHMGFYFNTFAGFWPYTHNKSFGLRVETLSFRV